MLGADTDVALDGEVLGKPRDAAHARELLARLAGRRHEVVGGIALAEHGAIVAADVVVTGGRLPRARRRRRSTGTSPPASGRAAPAATRSRAAGAALVAGIEGDYLNVVGLPLARLLDLCPALLPR